MKQIKAIQYGCGNIGKLCIKYMFEKGVQIVGAIDMNPDIVGKDIGELADIGVTTGVRVRDDVEKVLDECKSDIAILTLMTDMKTIYPHIEACVKRGINIITSSSHFEYPWDIFCDYANRIDAAAKEAGVTVLGSGSQEGTILNVIRAIATGVQKIDKIKSSFLHNTEPYGPAATKGYYIGLSQEEYNKAIDAAHASGDFSPNYLWGLCRGLAAGFGWTLKDIKQEELPCIAEVPTESAALGKIIPVGNLIGMIERVTLVTNQGPSIELNSICKVFRKEDGEDRDIWEFAGVPSVKFVFEDLQSKPHTASGIVNRIPTVLKAKPGLTTWEELPMSEYMSYPMNMYI